jgi:hypothetical protein
MLEKNYAKRAVPTALLRSDWIRSAKTVIVSK